MAEKDIFAVVTVSTGANVNFTASTNARKYRCVIPLLR
jgi:hypothetical protein